MQGIKAILFDADGVVQKPSLPWRTQIGNLISVSTNSDDFIAEIFAAEKPCLIGKGVFVEVYDRKLLLLGQAFFIPFFTKTGLKTHRSGFFLLR